MKVEEKLHLLKFFSAIFNTFFGILGVSIFGCALWILFDTGSFVAVLKSDVKTFAGCLFVVGLVATSVSVVGCAGAHLENRCLLVLDTIFLICIVLGQVFVTVLLLLNQGKVENILSEKVDAIISEYGNGTSGLEWKLLDNVQHYGQCCGRESHADWMKNFFISSLNLSWVNSSMVFPCSCFNSSGCSILASNITLFGTGSHYTEGCQNKILNWLKENIFAILGIDLGLLLIQVLQFVVAVYLFQNVGLKSRLRHACQLVQNPEPSNNSLEPNHGYPEPNHGYPEPNRGYPEPNRGYPEPNRGYQEPNLGYPETNCGYPETNLAYPETNLGESNLGYPETNYAYSDQNQAVQYYAHLEPTQTYQNPNQMRF
ncbi:tetraspanin-19 [Osmerus eperlanus]|uniref:tetraspanin-19 n=1 Tax=Osmerus eperlanus TaxID=29151 RepID=UPI002E0F04A3